MAMNRKGFTLIELMLIVAIISILTAMAVPNFLEAQTRAKVGRATMDMQSLKAGVRGYYSDHFVYPANHVSVDGFLAGPKENSEVVQTEEQQIELQDDPGPENTTDSEMQEENYFGGLSSDLRDELAMFGFPMDKPEHVSQFLDHSFSALYALTTPIAYIAGGVPKDIFNNRNFGDPSTFLYINSADLIQDDDPRWIPERRFLLVSEGPNVEFEIINGPLLAGPFSVYDPTNGTVSEGDLFVTGSDLSGRQMIAP